MIKVAERISDKVRLNIKTHESNFDFEGDGVEILILRKGGEWVTHSTYSAHECETAHRMAEFLAEIKS